MAQVSTADRALHLGADHAVRGVGFHLDRFSVGRPVERGPTGARVELVVANKELRSARGADVVSGVRIVFVLSVPGASVPFSNRIRYCSSVSCVRHSLSDLNIFSLGMGEGVMRCSSNPTLEESKAGCA